MHQGLKLVEADRASLFLVDQKTMQLYARIFGVTGEMDGEEIRQVDAAAQGKLRFPLDKGLAGHVATQGKAVIVQDCSKVNTNVSHLSTRCLRIRDSLMRLTRRPDTRPGDQNLHSQLCPGLWSACPSPSVAVSSQFYRWKLRERKTHFLLSQVLNKKLGEVEFTQDDLDIFQVALNLRLTKGRNQILCRCLHPTLGWPFTTPNCMTRSRRMSRSTRWCRRWSTTKVQHPSTKYKRWNHPGLD